MDITDTGEFTPLNFPIRFMLNVIKFRGPRVCVLCHRNLASRFLQKSLESLEETPSFFHEKNPGFLV